MNNHVQILNFGRITQVTLDLLLAKAALARLLRHMVVMAVAVQERLLILGRHQDFLVPLQRTEVLITRLRYFGADLSNLLVTVIVAVARDVNFLQYKVKKSSSVNFFSRKLLNTLFQQIIFLDFFFDESYQNSLNLFLGKKNLICVKAPKNNFSDPQTTNLNKTPRGHF